MASKSAQLYGWVRPTGDGNDGDAPSRRIAVVVDEHMLAYPKGSCYFVALNSA
jgi:hypothetical protein